MRLWAIKYADIDGRWWLDLALQERPPAIRWVLAGTDLLADGFDLVEGRFLVRKASIQSAELADWPSDTAVTLAPGTLQEATQVGPTSRASVGSAASA